VFITTLTATMTTGTDAATTFRLHHPDVLLYAPFLHRLLVWYISITTGVTNEMTVVTYTRRSAAAIATTGKTHGMATMSGGRYIVFNKS
jgi:hypothetical protein